MKQYIITYKTSYSGANDYNIQLIQIEWPGSVKTVQDRSKMLLELIAQNHKGYPVRWDQVVIINSMEL